MSVAVHVTMVSPNGKVAGASLVMESIPMMSVAVAVPITTGLLVGSIASEVTSAGAIIPGAVVSTIVTF